MVVQFGQVIPHLKALGQLILIISVSNNSMTLCHVIGHSLKRTVEIGAVAMWYQFVLAKVS